MTASSERPLLRFVQSVESLSPGDRARLWDRTTSRDATVRARTAEIVARVRTDGDAALRALAAELDGVHLDALEVPRARWSAALAALASPLRGALDRAAANIERIHRAFLPAPQEAESEPGVTIGRRADPLGRVGVYAPGGRAAYPSSVLMGVIPARVAGVGEILVCSPPGADGEPAAVVLAAAALAGADRVFALGGAGAVAAMALGTGTVPRVDRIVGPGNAYVAEAKVQLSSVVAIDSPAGPSELLVLADEEADAGVIAREMLAQAEHDPLAAVVAVVTGERLARAVVRELEAGVGVQPRSSIIREALAGQGAVLWTESVSAGLHFANAYAAEHLLLLVREEAPALAALRNAGTIFVGASASVAFGDYMSGANHVLPTGGLARCYSGLSTLDFIRWTTYQRITAEAAARLARDVAVFAEAEGLPGHAAAARAWGSGS